jgi:serine protease AprX
MLTMAPAFALSSSAPKNEVYNPLTEIDWNGDLDDNEIDDLIDQKLTEGSSENVNVYINYYSPPTSSDIDRLNKFEVEITYISKYLPTICARNIPIQLIPELTKLPDIRVIELQPQLVPLLDISSRAMKARESDNYSPQTAWELGYRGNGMNIAIMDTGVDDRHDSLQFKFVAGVDFTQDEGFLVPRDGTYNPDDVDGHGTHCAGIAMGTGGDDVNYVGVAPDAELIDVKVLNDWGPSPGDQLYQGIEWCIDYKDEFDIDILSISIGDLIPGNDDGQGSQGLLINYAVEEGLVVVVAAGNDGPDNNGFSDTAAADHAITVGAIDDMDSVTRSDDEIADFSSRGPRADDGDNDDLDEFKPDVVAPGVSIFSAMYSATPLGAVTGYQAQSGTSMACPHVAGLTALMLQAFPDSTPFDIKDALRQSAEAQGNPFDSSVDDKYNEDYGWGSVDAYQAIMACLSKYKIVDITSLESGDVLAGKVDITGESSAQLGEIDQVELKIGSEIWLPVNGTSTWNFELDTTSFANGQYQLATRAYNGQIYSNETAINIKINNIKTEIDSPSDGNTVDDTVLIEGTAVGSKINKIQVKVDNGNWQEAEQVGHKDNSDPNNPVTVHWEFDWDSTDAEDGMHTIYVRAYGDNKYNTPSDPVQIQVEVDNSATGLGEIAGIDVGLLLILIIIIVIIILSLYLYKKRD